MTPMSMQLNLIIYSKFRSIVSYKNITISTLLGHLGFDDLKISNIHENLYVHVETK